MRPEAAFATKPRNLSWLDKSLFVFSWLRDNGMSRGALDALAGPAFFLHDHQPVDARFLVRVDPLAVVAAHAFRLDDLRPLNRAPLARALADLACRAFRPPLDRQN